MSQEELTEEIVKDFNVLYVEDDADIAEVDVEIFKYFFKNIDLAVNGQQGLEMFQKAKYDLIITDENMPVMRGLEMIEKIREFDQEVRIVMITAQSDGNTIDRAMELNMHGFLTKPFDYTEVLDTILQR